MTGDEERKRLQGSIAWNNAMMIEAAWKDNEALEKHHRDEMQRLNLTLSRLDNLERLYLDLGSRWYTIKRRD